MANISLNFLAVRFSGNGTAQIVFALCQAGLLLRLVLFTGVPSWYLTKPHSAIAAWELRVQPQSKKG